MAATQITWARPPILALTAAILCLAPVSGASAADLSPTEEAIIAAVDGAVEDQIAFLERVVNINSGTLNIEGNRAVGAAFDAELKAIGFEIEWLEMPADMSRAGHLVARRSGSIGKKLLLLGHLDTVFPIDSPFQAYERDGNRASGPGVEDMKGGNAVMLYALKALHDAGVLENTQITIMLTGDEEMAGDPLSLSRGPMVELGKEADAALSFEGGEVDKAVVARRGSSNWQMKVTGKRAHSSGIFNQENGAGAIFEAARVLNGFYEEVRGEDLLTFNPGLLLGGTFIDADLEKSSGTAFGKTNVIAQEVIVSGGLRFISEEQKARARDKMREVAARSLPHTSTELTFEDRYPAMSPTPGNWALFEVLKGVNADLGMPELVPYDPGARGAGDVSFVAPYVDSMDGLGPTGDNGHSPEEYLDLDSLAPTTKRAALLIYRLTR